MRSTALLCFKNLREVKAKEKKKERPKTPARPPKNVEPKPDSDAVPAAKRSSSSKTHKQTGSNSGDPSTATMPSKSGFGMKNILKKGVPEEEEKERVNSEYESESQEEDTPGVPHRCCGHTQSSRRKKSPGKKKLVMLSRKVLEEVRKNPNSTGTQIANDIIEYYMKLQGKKLDFKNVQRRVYDALNVFAALGIINKERNNIEYTGKKKSKKAPPPPPSQAP